MHAGSAEESAPAEESARAEESAPDTAPFVLGHRPALDGVRGVAILLVLAVHTTYLLVPEYAGRFVPGGFIGVDIFFVLSGFLITSILLEEWDRDQRVSLTRFYRRRALRLFPALWAVMAAQLVYSLVEHDSRRSELKGLVAIFFYVGNWSWKFGALIPPTLGQTWSLAVEEQFYLLWPLLLLGLLRMTRRRVTVAVMAGLVAVAFLSRLALWHSRVPWTVVNVQTEVRLDALIVGALVAFGLKTGWRPTGPIGVYGWIGAACIGVVALTSHRDSGWLFEGGYTLVAGASALVILAALDRRTGIARALAARPARALGRLSYSLYLWHTLVFMAVERAWPARPGMERAVAGLMLTALAAVLSYHLIERPFLRRKNAASGVPARRETIGRWPTPTGGDI